MTDCATHASAEDAAPTTALVPRPTGALSTAFVDPRVLLPEVGSTAMSVVVEDPLPCTAVAVNLQQLRTTRFDDAKLVGVVDPAVMERVDQALRAVLDL
ncbi:hypothetical protein OG948_34200 (plasmid) [Embleya sp. NBC_00888]|uniref:hypothetical protein n=1 Tax=Embleya sp. NBC_00888 TaxID=2975960 RepID=UPI002F916AC2|nr:hypothetical protein OG948_34200 [Embleya sp. NBC_00888]